MWGFDILKQQTFAVHGNNVVFVTRNFTDYSHMIDG